MHGRDDLSSRGEPLARDTEEAMVKGTILRVGRLLRSPLGRKHLALGAFDAVWPLVYCAVRLYRGTLARRKRVIAVTGSFGKTTTARAVFAALGCRGPEPSQYNMRGAVARALMAGGLGDRPVVVEVAAGKAGMMAAHARMLQPDITVVTCIGSEHVHAMGGLEKTRAEKSELVRILPETGTAVLNGDDSHVRWMRGVTRARVVTFGTGEDNQVRASGIVLDWPRGTRFTLHAAGQECEVRTKLIGRKMVYAVLAAVAVGLAEGLGLDRILPGLEALAPTTGRMQPVFLANGAVVLRDDHKSALETVEAALDVLAEIEASRRIVVLGDVSDHSGGVGPVYRHIGERVGRVASLAVFTTSSRRNLRPYRAGAVHGGLPREAIVHLRSSVRGIVELLRSELGPGDVVLLKGRFSEHLARVALALSGRDVRCDLPVCSTNMTTCDSCPMLERGWKGRVRGIS